MPKRVNITAPAPAAIHGDNLAEEIRKQTGLQAVDVTLVGDVVQVAISGERPSGETEELTKQIRRVVGRHKGRTPQQAELSARILEVVGTPSKLGTLDRLADKVAAGEDLTQDEINEAVKAWLLTSGRTRR